MSKDHLDFTIAQLGECTLDNPNRNFLPIGCAAKSQNSLAKLLGYDELVVNLIISDGVHRPP